MSHLPRSFVILSLSLLVCLGVLGAARAVAGTEPGTIDANQPPAAEAANPSGESTVVVYYFHGKRRCRTCLTLEAYAQEALETWFGEELRDGKVEWHVVNFEEPENEHYVDDFDLAFSSVVVTEMRAEERVRFQVLGRAMELVGDKQRFTLYVTQAVREYLEQGR